MILGRGSSNSCGATDASFSLLVHSDTVAKWSTLALVSATLLFGRDFIYKAGAVARKERKRENAEKVKQTD